MWQCTAEWSIIQYAPRLHILSTGIRPKKEQKFVLLNINGSNALRELNYLMLPYHDIGMTSATVSQVANSSILEYNILLI